MYPIAVIDIAKVEPSANQRLANGEKFSFLDAETLLLAKEHKATTILVNQRIYNSYSAIILKIKFL